MIWNSLAKSLVHCQMAGSSHCELCTYYFWWLHCQIIDFVQNYACVQQDAIQAVAWIGVNQVTIHPCETYGRCPEDNGIVTEEIVILSADMMHWNHAVIQFTQQNLDHLQENRGVTAEHLVHISDGCSSQYKPNKTFQDIILVTYQHGEDIWWITPWKIK